MTESLSKELHRLAHHFRGEKPTLKAVVLHVGPESQALFTLIFSIPFLLSIPLPGISMVLGFFIFLNGFRIGINKGMWLPKFLLKRQISGDLLSKIFHIGARVIKHVEKLIRPRGKFLSKHPLLQCFHGFLIALCGFFFMLPLPIGTTILSGLSTVCLSLGTLEKDGLFIVLGYVFFACSIAFYVFLLSIGIAKLK